MGNYKGYFSGLDCKKYEVRITSSGDSSAYQEILLAGDAPFTVTYNTSSTPFDPVRTSTATISIVHDDYLEDALSSCAQGTKIELLDITNTASTVTKWVGFLTPKVYDAGYEECYETFELEAADCISSLQYVDYNEMSGGGIVSIINILGQACDAAELLDGFYWSTGSKKVGNSYLYPERVSISEHNFQTNDTEEEWKLSEVLEEICRYFGLTCMQWGKRMYFIDLQELELNSSIYVTYYSKASGYQRGATSYLDGEYEVTADSYMSNGASISFEPIYNKVVVNANMYAAEEFIPNPFDDKHLVNRLSPSGDFYTNFEVLPASPDKATYPQGGTWYTLGFEQNFKEESSGDSQYRYFHRLYDNKYWESVYTTPDGGAGSPSQSVLKSSGITKDYRGGTIVDLGVVRKDYRSETQQWIVPSKLDYTRYLCICELHGNPSSYGGTNPGANKVVYRLKDGFKSRVLLDEKSFLVLDCSAIFQRHKDRNYINPSWDNTECNTNWAAAGRWRNSIASPSFRIHIGNMGWSSYLNRWVSAGTANDYCRPTMKWDSNKKDFWNKEIAILNNVSWEDKVNCEGVKIPLSGVDVTQAITFEILNPNPAFYGNTGSPNFVDKFYDVNAYCWISDLSLKCVQEGQDGEGNDSDVVYENEISGCSVNELNEIRVRLTTHVDSVKPSYSHVIWTGGGNNEFLTGIKDEALGNATPQKPEENIIQRYVHQYSTPTKKITLTIDSDINPFQKIVGADVDNPNTGYVQLGTEIDYRMGRQTMTIIEKEK